ncbi:MAG: hypothetical protein QOJ07_3332 [Thermoleophilaceae bacterium]|nr:hypothetical protein [Thermoleophilaceae bacterium]
MRHLRVLPLLLIAAALAPASASAAPDPVAGFPYETFFADSPVLVSGGVAVLELNGRTVQLTSIDTASGSRTTVFSKKVDRRINFDFDRPTATAAIADGRVAVSYASSYSPDGETIHALGGQILTRPLTGGNTVTLHSCAAQTDAPPIALSGSLLVAAEGTNCGADAFGENAKYDIVVHDLAAQTTRTLAPGTIVASGGLSAAGTYVAVVTGPDAGGEGFADRPDRLRVYDTRTSAVVTDLPLNGDDLFDNASVRSDGSLVACTGDLVRTAAPGATALAPTTLACRGVQALADGRVLTVRGRQIDLTDPATGSDKRLLRSSTALPGFDSDGTRVAWTDRSCRTALVHVADLASVDVNTPRLTCPSAVGATVKLAGRSVHTTLSCPNGCAGDLQIYLPGHDFPLATTPVDPKPGVRTKVSIPLTRNVASTLSKHSTVNVTLVLDATGQFRSRTRRLLK